MKTKKLWILSIFAVFLSLSFLALLKPPVSHAGLVDYFSQAIGYASQQESENRRQHIEAVVKGEEYGAVNQEYSTQNVTTTTMRTMSMLASGVSEEDVAGLTEEEKRVAYGIYGRGAIGEVGGFIAALYTPPASTRTYLADLFHSAKITPQAQAQGIGFASLDPILTSWKVFRNIAYLFFVLIFLVIGFMIMFQHKIDGQTAITAQQAIPQIIVSLAFVTFSYAIAGLLIDLMYVFMYFLISLFNASGNLLNLNAFGMAAKLIKTGWQQSFDAVSGMLDELIGGGLIKDTLGFAATLLVKFIVAIGILFGVFKLFLELLKSYVSIILQVAFAPLLLMIGAIPGQNVFGSWIKQLVGNLLAFPTVLLMLLISEVITNYEIEAGGFMPPFLIGQGLGGAMPAVIGIGILLALPEIVQKVKKAAGVDEGIFGELAGAAGGRFGKAAPWGGGAALGIMGGAGGAVGGGLKGALMGIEEGRSIRGIAGEAGHGVWRGGQKGLVGGAALPQVPRLARRVGGTMWRQGVDFASAETLGHGLRRLEEATDSEIVREMRRRLEQQTEARGGPQTRPRVDETGVDENEDNFGH